jgi:hypothetical protein
LDNRSTNKDKKVKSTVIETTAMASDGSYLYLHNKDQGLLKVGTGYHYTVRGHIYKFNPSYHNNDGKSQLALIKDRLYFLSSEIPTTTVDSKTVVNQDQKQENHSILYVLDTNN